MSAVQQRDERLAGFESVFAEQPKAATHFLEKFRKQSYESFLERGLPSPDEESWRLTNLAPIFRNEFRLAHSADTPIRHAASIGDVSVAELVFVNGNFSQERSRAAEQKGLTVSRFGDKTASALLERHLGSLLPKEHPIALMNGAFLGDGVVIHVAANAVIEHPVHLLFLSTPDGTPILSAPRILVVAEEGSQLRLVESYGGNGMYLSVAAAEIVAGAGAVVDHYRIQRESTSAYHLSVTAVGQARDSSYHSHSISFGGALTRNDLSIALNGAGAECILDGLYILAGQQHLDNHTSIEHAVAQTSSVELYKGILDDSSRGVFDGRVVVMKDAQKTTARQTNQNLLLSNEAIADSNPTLEIYADDVKCNHGSTIGQLDEDALFYLRSRGIAPSDARDILTYAFAGEIVERMTIAAVRETLEQQLLRRLPHSEER